MTEKALSSFYHPSCGDTHTIPCLHPHRDLLADYRLSDRKAAQAACEADGPVRLPFHEQPSRTRVGKAPAVVEVQMQPTASCRTLILPKQGQAIGTEVAGAEIAWRSTIFPGGQGGRRQGRRGAQQSDVCPAPPPDAPTGRVGRTG
jgi:hypothetical protein